MAEPVSQGPDGQRSAARLGTPCCANLNAAKALFRRVVSFMVSTLVPAVHFACCPG